MLSKASLLLLLVPAAAATRVCQLSANNQTQPTNQTLPSDPSAPTNGTGSTNGTIPEDDTPWVPTCKLPRYDFAWLSVGHGFMSDCVHSKGTIQGHMIFVDFSDAEALEGESPEDAYDLLVPDANKWFQEISHGQLELNITAHTSKFYRMPNSAESYGWDSGLSNQQHYAYVEDALDAYMNNGENPPPPVTDILYVVPTRNAAWLTRSLASSFGAFTRNNTFVSSRAITFGVDPYNSWGFKALNHETGHSMCLPDLYPLDINFPTGEYVGGYSVMGNVGGIAPDFFAWDKWRLGWLADEDVDCILEHGTTRHTLTPLETQGGTKAVVVAANKTSALVAEARTAKGADEKICAPGVLLYTIDTTRSTGEGPIRVLDATPGSDSCGSEVSGWEPMNDATLSLSGIKSYEVSGWGIKVTLIDDKDNEFKIEVEYS
ncbi:hypothetical protein LCI18_013767 [Fusarium solani-melongenae]|uniref:Uncharacterized protein n=1 Tax=Fusarium solani subsp. cucurbitae TaxID=2747967 RepID=A0ACD3ZP01_FUSSC|nr:hypothetical protein LCI18_013767 [Fusarium solani-melongenae]